MPEASPIWQNLFLVGVLVAFGWCVWNGWRTGVVRALCSLFAMVVALVVGLFIGVLVLAVMAGISLTFGIIAGWIAGVVSGLVVYFILTFVAALLLKRTSQQKTIALRLVYGIGGAAIGVLVGLSIYWGAIMFVRGIGGFWEPRFQPVAAHSPLPKPNAAEAVVVKLKRSIEAGSTGRTLLAGDVMPESFYRVVNKLGQMLVDPRAVNRFFQYPDIVAVLNDPAFSSLMAGSSGNGASVDDYLRTNQRLLAATKDPALIEKLQKIELEKALDFALQEPAPDQP